MIFNVAIIASQVASNVIAAQEAAKTPEQREADRAWLEANPPAPIKSDRKGDALLTAAICFECLIFCLPFWGLIYFVYRIAMWKLSHR